MNYKKLLHEIDPLHWKNLEEVLTESIRIAPNDPLPLCLAAHLSLRQGEHQRARLLANKALGLDPTFLPAYLELILIDFYRGELEKSHQALRTLSLEELPDNHPIHFAKYLLKIIFDDTNSISIENLYAHRQSWKNWLEHDEIVDAFLELFMNAPPSVSPSIIRVDLLPDHANRLLSSGDHLAANVFAKLSQLILPNSPYSFWAVGLVNLHQGFFNSASKALNEATYRQFQIQVDLLYCILNLYCRQQRFVEAVEVANKIISANAMSLDGLGLYIDLLIRTKNDQFVIRNCLDECLKIDNTQNNAWIRIASLRYSLFAGEITKNDAIHIISNSNDLAESAPGLYLHAHLLHDLDPLVAQSLAKRAIKLCPFHPEAKFWNNDHDEHTYVFEYMGLYLPAHHEGCAWPTERQSELLRIIFAATASDAISGWHQFLQKYEFAPLDAGSYRLLPLLHSKLTHANSNLIWNKADFLKGIWKKCFLENATRIKFIVNLMDLLSTHQIDFILLKGLANTVVLYGDLGARPMSDIDILIAPNELERCHEILTSHGWMTDTPPSPQRLRFQYASTYLHSDGGNLDLHWRPAEEFTTDFYDPADLGESNVINWMGHKITTLNPTTNLACTIFHGVAWNHLSPVRWVCDSNLLIQNLSDQIDWVHFDRLVQKYRMSHVVRAGLEYLLSQFPELDRHVAREFLNSKNSSEDELRLLIRCRSRSSLANLDELILMAEDLKHRFAMEASDRIWVCANHLKPDEISTVNQLGLDWISNFDSPLLETSICENNYSNYFVIDGNINGYLRTIGRIQS